MSRNAQRADVINEFERGEERVENRVIIVIVIVIISEWRTMAINQADFLGCVARCWEAARRRRSAAKVVRWPAGRIVTHDCWPLLGGLRLPIKSRTLDLRAQTYEPAGGEGRRGAVAGV